MYDCKLMELGERSLWSGWAAGRSFLWWMVDGGCWTPGRRVPVCSGLRRGLASRLPEFC